MDKEKELLGLARGCLVRDEAFRALVGGIPADLSDLDFTVRRTGDRRAFRRRHTTEGPVWERTQ